MPEALLNTLVAPCDQRAVSPHQEKTSATSDGFSWSARVIDIQPAAANHPTSVVIENYRHLAQDPISVPARCVVEFRVPCRKDRQFQLVSALKPVWETWPSDQGGGHDQGDRM